MLGFARTRRRGISPSASTTTPVRISCIAPDDGIRDKDPWWSLRIVTVTVRGCMELEPAGGIECDLENGQARWCELVNPVAARAVRPSARCCTSGAAMAPAARGRLW
jgi:hypothetical protein